MRIIFQHRFNERVQNNTVLNCTRNHVYRFSRVWRYQQSNVVASVYNNDDDDDLWYLIDLYRRYFFVLRITRFQWWMTIVKWNPGKSACSCRTGVSNCIPSTRSVLCQQLLGQRLHKLQGGPSLAVHFLLARDVIYTSCPYATMSVSVCLSVCLWRKCIGAL